MIDIHCHILPDIDDGAGNLNVSLKMGQTADENNIVKIAATPHYICTSESNGFVKFRNTKIDELRDCFEKNDVKAQIVCGAEVYLNDDIYFDNQLEKLTINSTRYLLVEMSFVGLTMKKITRYLDEIVSRGLVPIVAHPERYEYFQQDYGMINYLADMGTLFQVNMTSLAGIDSAESRMLAAEMVKNGVAAFLATDSHGTSLRNNETLKFLNMFPKGIDNELLNSMLEENPRHVLNNEPVTQKYRHISKHFFR